MRSFFTFFMESAAKCLFASVKRLPEKVPYGFWISPSGEFSPVLDIAGHNRAAFNIVSCYYPDYKGDDAMVFLYTKNFIRVVIRNQTVYYDTYTKQSPVTEKQKGLLFFLRDFYNQKQVRDDNGNVITEKLDLRP